jgi:hypothetical protein
VIIHRVASYTRQGPEGHERALKLHAFQLTSTFRRLQLLATLVRRMPRPSQQDSSFSSTALLRSSRRPAVDAIIIGDLECQLTAAVQRPKQATQLVHKTDYVRSELQPSARFCTLAGVQVFNKIYLKEAMLISGAERSMSFRRC